MGVTERERLAPDVFRLPVEKIREGYYSDVYFNYAKATLELEDRHPRVLMQVFQRKESILGGIDEAVAILRQCAGRRRPDGSWEDGWEQLEVHALHEGDEIAPWETVMTIEGDYSLFAHLETVYLGTLARRTLVMHNVREVVDAAGRQADPLLPRPPRPLAGADRRRLGGARRRRHRGLHRRAGVVVGRPRRRHRSARADRGVRRRHGGSGACLHQATSATRCGSPCWSTSRTTRCRPRSRSPTRSGTTCGASGSTPPTARRPLAAAPPRPGGAPHGVDAELVHLVRDALDEAGHPT